MKFLRTFFQKRAPSFIESTSKRQPDFYVGGKEDPYLIRWYLIPRNPVFNVYLHLFCRSDDDRALHDHPWLFNLSILLLGSYVEHLIKEGGIHTRTVYTSGDIKFRLGSSPHRLELISVNNKLQPCWTLFLTGPRVRQWGFHCPEKGWVHFKDFTKPGDQGSVGKGCDT